MKMPPEEGLGPGEDTERGGGCLQIAGTLVSCPRTPHFFPEKHLFLCQVCGLCAIMSVQPLLILAGSRNWLWEGAGLGSPSLGGRKQQPGSTLACGQACCRLFQTAAYFISIFIFLAYEATGPGKRVNTWAALSSLSLEGSGWLRAAGRAWGQETESSLLSV